VLHRIQPDLVQAGPLQTTAFLVALTGFRPLVSMSWGYDLLFDAHRNAAWRWATRFTLKHSAIMIGDCQTIRQRAVEMGMPDKNIVTFPWGVDLELFSPIDPTARMIHRSNNRVNIESDDFVLLSTRSWESLYGVLDLAKAFVSAARKHPQLRLVMLGNGSQASELRRTFLAAGMQDRVIFPGQISQTDLPHFYHMADLYISPSHSDGTSISLLEALACGTPVVTSNVSSLPEVVGDAALMVEPTDSDALAVAMQRALTEADLRSQMVSRGFAQARRFTWPRAAEQLLTAYNRLL